MNNIVDAVNQNSTNAIQAAVLARLFGGAQANPVIGGVNQAEAPTQDLVSNAMNKQQAVAIPQLMGARATLSGKGGALGGIGDALMNMYNSRIARSENEVKFAQEAEQAKKQEEAAVKRFAAEQGIKLKTEKEVLAYKEGLDSSVAETKRTKAQTANILSEMARRDKTPIKGMGTLGASGATGTDLNATFFGPDANKPITPEVAKQRADILSAGLLSGKYNKSQKQDIRTVLSHYERQIPKEFKKDIQDKIVASYVADGYSYEVAKKKYDYETTLNKESAKQQGSINFSTEPPVFEKTNPPVSTPPQSTTQPQVAPVIPPNAVIKVDEQGRRYYEN